MSDKVWANSGDSHFIEPAGLWHEMMPKALADRMPRSEHSVGATVTATVSGAAALAGTASASNRSFSISSRSIISRNYFLAGSAGGNFTSKSISF